MITFSYAIFFLQQLIESFYLYLAIFLLFFLFKGSIFGILLSKSIQTKNRPLIFLLAVSLVGSLGVDLGWIYAIARKLFFPTFHYALTISIIRFLWLFFLLQDIGIAFFIEHLVSKNLKLTIRHKAIMALTIAFAAPIFYFIIFNGNCQSPAQRSDFEIAYFQISAMYLNFFILPLALFFTINKVRKTQLPSLISKQLKLLIFTVFGPFLIFEIIQYLPFNISLTKGYVTNSFACAILSNIILTLGLYYCSRKIAGFRFLNLQERVTVPVNADFIKHFRTALKQFSRATYLHQLHAITQNFIQDALTVPVVQTTLVIRDLQQTKKLESQQPSIMTLSETFLKQHAKELYPFIQKEQVLSYEEISFNNFYETTKEQTLVLDFLTSINADIFLPIYEEEHILAYIVIQRHARKSEFYSKEEYDELGAFASYLGTMISLLQSKELKSIIQKENRLKDELYTKHQENNQYKESIRSFLRSKERSIGIIFYRNRRFYFGNQTAKELIQLNLDLQQKHPTSKALRELAHQVVLYKSTQSCFIKDSQGNKLAVDAVPDLEHTNTIILFVYYPEVADLVKDEISQLKDPTDWNYLIYLETTKAGKLISQLIPGNGETVLNFKVALLKAALSRKATLITVPEEDLASMVDIVHQISLREVMHTIELKAQCTSEEWSIQLFGASSVYGPQQKPLLEQLNGVGTLFIKNVHYLDLETQKQLADFITYGFFKAYKSNHKIVSNVRIICSTDQSLKTLVQQDLFSAELYEELAQMSVPIPSLDQLPENELIALVQAYSEQAAPHEDFKELLTLNDQERLQVASMGLSSFKELRQKVQQRIIKKSTRHSLPTTLSVQHEHDIVEPELIEAVRLGKRALKDRKLFAALWNKYKNQNKIALMLGVNRSSVNRRCKMYDLTE